MATRITVFKERINVLFYPARVESQRSKTRMTDYSFRLKRFSSRCFAFLLEEPSSNQIHLLTNEPILGNILTD